MPDYPSLNDGPFPTGSPHDTILIIEKWPNDRFGKHYKVATINVSFPGLPLPISFATFSKYQLKLKFISKCAVVCMVSVYDIVLLHSDISKMIMLSSVLLPYHNLKIFQKYGRSLRQRDSEDDDRLYTWATLIAQLPRFPTFMTWLGREAPIFRRIRTKPMIETGERELFPEPPAPPNTPLWNPLPSDYLNPQSVYQVRQNTSIQYGLRATLPCFPPPPTQMPTIMEDSTEDDLERDDNDSPNLERDDNDSPNLYHLFPPIVRYPSSTLYSWTEQTEALNLSTSAVMRDPPQQLDQPDWTRLTSSPLNYNYSYP